MGLKTIFKAVLGRGNEHDINDPNQWAPTNTWFPLFSKAGTRVTPGTSMQLSAYYACIRNISEDVAKLNCGAYRNLPEGGKELVPRSPSNILFTVMPNEEMTPFSFKQTIVSHVLGWGNGYAEIQRNGRGDVVALHPIHPSRVTVERAEDGSIYYRVFKVPFDSAPHLRGQGEYVDIAPEDMFHVLGLGGDGLVGYSVAKFAQDSLGTALAAQTYGATFFGNGSTLGGLLEHPASLSKEAQDRLLDSWNKKHQGPNNAHKTAVLEEGMKFKSTAVPPRDSQFIEVREFQVVDVARWFRMPPHKIQSMEGAKFNNIEHQSIEYVQDTILPILVKFEEEIKRKIITQNAVFFKFNTNTLLRGDAKARSEYYRTMINIGAMTPNEARAFEDMNPGDDSLDQYFMQSAMSTLDQIVAGEPEEVTEEIIEVDDPQEPDEDVEDGESEDDQMAEALGPVLHSAIDRVQNKEMKAMQRQEKKGHDKEWADKFFSEQCDMAFSNLAAVVTTYGNAKKWSENQHCRALADLQASLDEVYFSRLTRYTNQEAIGDGTELQAAFFKSIDGGNHVS